MYHNQEDKLKKKIRQCQKTARKLEKEYRSLLQKRKQTDTKGDSDHSGKQAPIVDDANKRLMEIDLALESAQQQLKLALEKYLTSQTESQSALPASVDNSTVQSDDNQLQIAKININQHAEPSDDNNGQIEATLTVNPTVQTLFNGTLPDDFYLHLMSVTGLKECLLSNRLVCSFWNDLVLERCHSQKSLKLFETFNCLMNYGELLLKYEKTEDTALILKSIGDDLILESLETDHEQIFEGFMINRLENDEYENGDIQKEVLSTKFPSVEQLVLCPEDDTLINVKHLLQYYAKQLTSLTMTDFGTCFKSAASQLLDFSFPKLTSLNTFNFSLEDDQLLSLLPQLESLTPGTTVISLETLLRTGTQLRELNLDFIQSVYAEPEDEFSKRPQIISNLRKFSFDSTADALQTLEFISLNLTSLEYLKLDLDECKDKLDWVTSFLVPLQQLHSLTLEAPVSFFILDDNQFVKIKPLPSVRHLKLRLWKYASLSMDLFSRALFTAFPKLEQVLVGFVGDDGEDGLVDSATFAAFEDIAGKHPNVVQLFRSKDISKFTDLPNAVSPLLGHRRQVYEEYIGEVELFGVPIFKLTASLVKQEAEGGPNLKIILRPVDRLNAISNLLQLLERKAFTFTIDMVNTMGERLIDCALRYDSSQVALFTATCKCVIFLLGCRAVDEEYDSDDETSSDGMVGYDFFNIMLHLVEHYQRQQFKAEDLLLQMHNYMDKYIKKMFNEPEFEFTINRIIAEDRPYRVEMARALLRVCNSTKNCFRSD